MNCKLWLIAFFAIFHSSLLHAQERKWWIGFSLNYNVYGNSILKNNDGVIRPGKTTGTDLVHNVNMWNIGAHIERKVSPKLFVLTGIMGSQLNIVNKVQNGLWNTNYFFVLGRETSDRIQYLKTSRVVVYNNYITIPLELRYEFLQGERNAMYVKGGFSTSFAVATNGLSIQGHADEEMSDDVRNEYFFNSRDVFSTANVSLGWRIGKPKNVISKIELGITQPLVNSIGNRKIGPGFSLTYLLSVPIKTK